VDIVSALGEGFLYQYLITAGGKDGCIREVFLSTSGNIADPVIISHFFKEFSSQVLDMIIEHIIDGPPFAFQFFETFIKAGEMSPFCCCWASGVEKTFILACNN
jgi:hypothetical protein